jgi:electron transport complex protein RnfG
MIKIASILVLFTAISIAIVTTIKEQTKTQITQNIRINLLQKLNEIMPSQNYDNDLIGTEKTYVVFLHETKQTITIYTATKNNKKVATLIKHTYPKGYTGNITLLTGIDTKGKLLGIRVISHKETPGLGDRIELRKSNWIRQFKGLSLTNPINWSVKKDGGSFDSFSGATITPRAIVNATSEVLHFQAKFKENKPSLK